MRLLKKLLFTILCLFFTGFLMAQQPYIHVVHPYKSVINTTKSRNYLSGNTCKGCSLSINGQSVKVYPTGAFAIQLDLEEGDTSLILKSVSSSDISKTKEIVYHYKIPTPPSPVKDFKMTSVKIFPSGKCWLMPGDRVRFKIRAQPGNKITIDNKIVLYEQPASQTGGIQGIYQGTHVVKPNDPLLKKTLLINMENDRNKTVTYSLSPQIKILDPDVPVVGKSAGRIPYLEFGRGVDRLGGAKINYIDTAVLLHITGMFDNQYRVQLAPGHSAFIPIKNISFLSKGTFIPKSLAGSWRVWGGNKYDYVSIGLNEKLPYTTFQQIDPSRIVIDIYGATANTNWITQLKTAKEIKDVWYEQLSDHVLRVTLSLKHQQQWGYAIYYEGNNLTIRVKRQPQTLDLAHLTIAIDAGHGGSNSGAQGPTSVLEKTITLQIAKKLRKVLTASGAKVIMTRRSDITKSMIDRILMLRKTDPNLLVSIHCNASADPIHIKGTSTYYRYIGFRPLSQAILNRMLGLDLKNFGNIGRFNFALNGPTEYPNALVETLFLSNPEDEMKALDPAFQEKVAQAVKAGIIDFLKQAK